MVMRVRKAARTYDLDLNVQGAGEYRGELGAETIRGAICVNPPVRKRKFVA